MKKRKILFGITMIGLLVLPIIPSLYSCSNSSNNRGFDVTYLQSDLRDAYQQGLDDGKYIGRNAAIKYFASQSKDTLTVDLYYLLNIEDSLQLTVQKNY